MSSMRKGLTLTLFATFVAILAVNAMAEAPTIGAIPDVVVGGDVDATAPLEFVFPDALDLDRYVSDDTSASADIIWSYTYSVPADLADPRYLLNGVNPLDLGSDDPNAPGDNRLDTNDDDDGQVDDNPRTITFRDQIFSPLEGVGDQTPLEAGIVASKVVTLIASDGSTYSMKEIIVYSDNEGENRLSPSEDIVLPLIDFSSITATAAGYPSTPLIGTVTYSEVDGACITVPASGANLGSFRATPDNAINLTANSVYQIRLTVSTDQSGDGQVPFWDVVIANFFETHPVTGAPLNGPNNYGGDYLFLDADGGANAVADSRAVGGPTRGRSLFEVWYAPPQVNIDGWNSTSTGGFSPANAEVNDFTIEFRVLDVDAGHQPASNPDLGAVCMDTLEIVKHDFDTLMTGASSVYDVSTITAATHTAAGLIPGSTTIVFSGGNVTMTPTANPGWEVEVVSVNPGDGIADPVTGIGVADDYPITWEDDTLYAVSVTASAPTQLGEDDPPDSLRFGLDTITNELFGLGFVTPTLDGIASTKLGESRTYYTFVYGHSASLSPVAADISLRPRIDLLCAPTFKANAEADNLGGFTVEAVKVDKLIKP
jgi:hypothetical protein